MQTTNNPIIKLWRRTPLIAQIALGLILGILLGIFSPDTAVSFQLLGSIFIAGLKSVAPILVFILVISAIANHKRGQSTNIKPLIGLYAIGTLIAAFIAVGASSLMPAALNLTTGDTALSPPSGITEVLSTLVFNIVTNPVDALLNANYIGILTWAVLLGLGLQSANEQTKQSLVAVADAVSGIVKLVIAFAPLGIFGLVAHTIATTGLSALASYSHLLMLLVGCMLAMALIINPIIVFVMTRVNPYPIVFRALISSGIPAFFTRSSAANIPVNLDLSKRLKLPEDTYSVSIPLGATVNMAGAAITITTLTLATAHTLGIQVDFLSALLLCVVAAVSACGASGVAGGSLLLIPLACGLFGIDNEIAMQVVAIGFIISVIQDSFETALNSSTDVVYTWAACASADPELQTHTFDRA